MIRKRSGAAGVGGTCFLQSNSFLLYGHPSTTRPSPTGWAFRLSIGFSSFWSSSPPCSRQLYISQRTISATAHRLNQVQKTKRTDGEDRAGRQLGCTHHFRTVVRLYHLVGLRRRQLAQGRSRSITPVSYT